MNASVAAQVKALFEAMRSGQCALVMAVSLLLVQGAGFAADQDVAGGAPPLGNPNKEMRSRPVTKPQVEGLKKNLPRASGKTAAGAAQPKGDAKRPERRPAAKKPGTARSPAGAPGKDPNSQMADACRERLKAIWLPTKVVKLAEECEKGLAQGPRLDEIRQIATVARRTMAIQRSAGLSGDLFEHPDGDGALQDLTRKAARGDKDAAYRVAQAYKTGQAGVASNARRMEQWLRFPAELGNGRASWELAEHYNYAGLVADAAKFEKKAQASGYRPGVRLPSRGY